MSSVLPFLETVGLVVELALGGGKPMTLCVVSGVVQDYQVPFYDLVPSDPSFEEMKKVVVDSKMRPTVSSHWYNDEVSASSLCVVSVC